MACIILRCQSSCFLEPKSVDSCDGRVGRGSGRANPVGVFIPRPSVTLLVWKFSIMDDCGGLGLRGSIRATSVWWVSRS